VDVIKATVCKALRNLANKIEAGNCELDEEQAMNIMSVIGHEVLSKDEACRYLNMSRSKFDSLIAYGKLPKGKKRRGFKELCWFKDELVIK
jgi:hypothetical protein